MFSPRIGGCIGAPLRPSSAGGSPEQSVKKHVGPEATVDDEDQQKLAAGDAGPRRDQSEQDPKAEQHNLTEADDHGGEEALR